MRAVVRTHIHTTEHKTSRMSGWNNIFPSRSLLLPDHISSWNERTRQFYLSVVLVENKLVPIVISGWVYLYQIFFHGECISIFRRLFRFRFKYSTTMWQTSDYYILKKADNVERMTQRHDTWSVSIPLAKNVFYNFELTHWKWNNRERFPTVVFRFESLSLWIAEKQSFLLFFSPFVVIFSSATASPCICVDVFSIMS